MKHFIFITFMVILIGGCFTEDGKKKDDGGDQTWDGTITRADAPFASGLTSNYAVAVDVSSNTAGTAGEEDEMSWDYSGALTGDHSFVVEYLAIEGQWFESSFTGASYAARMSYQTDLLGVYELTDDSLMLRGIVSPAGGSSRTELVYNPAVKILAFPLQSGVTFSTDTNISGLADGVTVNYTERHESLVDSRGTITTPYGTMPVLRVRVLMTRTYGAIVTTARSYTFINKDHGIVGYIKSQDNESSTEFTELAEIWRLEQ